MDSAPPNDVDRLFALEQVDEGRFRGLPLEPKRFRLFGGQTMAQGMLAANRTVGPDRQVHSLHAYFLRPGDAAVEIDYVVHDLREGRSFSTRRVEAVQGNRVIFEMITSFQPPETGLEHQWTMPAGVPEPESLAADSLGTTVPDELKVTDLLELRSVGGRALPGAVTPPEDAPSLVWSRVHHPLPDAHIVHAALLAYSSDMTLLTSAGKPQNIGLDAPGLQVASLDHVIWFHRDFRIDEWLLQEVVSPSLSGSRALTQGRVYRRDGVLVASMAQEGLLRQV